MQSFVSLRLVGLGSRGGGKESRKDGVKGGMKCVDL